MEEAKEFLLNIFKEAIDELALIREKSKAVKEEAKQERAKLIEILKYKPDLKFEKELL